MFATAVAINYAAVHL